MLLVLLGFVVLAIIDLFPLIKYKAKKEINAFLVLFFIALILGILGAANLEMPTLMQLLSDFLEKIGIGYKD